MVKKQRKNWIIDVILYVGFLVSMYLNVTGFEVHQFLGLAVVLLAGYHLMVHGRWFMAISRKVFVLANGQARNWYLVDVALLLGFLAIGGTGLVISSWLNLNLSDYSFWRDLHVYASIITLVLVVVKIGLHWRWVAMAAKRSLFAASAVRHPVPAPEVQPATTGMMGRRQFLGVMGVVGVTAVVASCSAVLGLLKASQGTAIASAVEPQTLANASGASATGSTTTTNTATSTPTSTTTATAAGSSPITSCTPICNKGCSYPGQCRKYVDTNKNKKCDLGECLS